MRFSVNRLALLLCFFVPSAVLAGPPAVLDGAFPSKDFSPVSRSYLHISDRGQLSYARFLYEAGDFKKAAREAARVIENFPLSPLKEEAHFMMADADLSAGLYREASIQFRQFLGNFIASPFAEQATLKLLEAQKRLDESREKPPEPLVMPSVPTAVQTTSTAGAPAMRAVQVMVFGGRDMTEVENEIQGLKEAGVDTIIFRVFHNRGDRFYRFIKPRVKEGVYFNTTRAPVVADALTPVLDCAHKNGMRVFAWMTSRYADYGIAWRDDIGCRGYDVDKREITRCKGLDMFSEEAVRHLEGLYRDLASHDIDGILFQDDLVLKYNEGFGPHAAELFRKENGTDVFPEELYIRRPGSAAIFYTPRFWEWAAWKNRRLLGVAKRLKEAASEVNPRTRFAINLMYEAVTSPSNALAWLSQDIERAMEAGFDYYAVMAYQRQMADELRLTPDEAGDMIEGMAREASRIVEKPERVLIKLQTIDWTTGHPLNDADVVGLLRRIKGSYGVSLAVVPYRAGFPFNELGGAAKGFASLD
ncbi:MAG: hypothetical protein HY890_04845 [Deltaproteobacteria bacterium]|nr:hypothetical protein [Deltaproteobacteria bacterium]